MSYTIKNICLEFDMVSDPELTRQLVQPYSGKMVILYDSILRHRKKKSDILWNFNLNVSARSMQYIILLFEDPSRQTQNNSYYNPMIEKVEMTIEGAHNQLYSQGMWAYQQWDKINNVFCFDIKKRQSDRSSSKRLVIHRDEPW